MLYECNNRNSILNFHEFEFELGRGDVPCKVEVFKCCCSQLYSIYNKKDELSSFHIENDVDIVLGSETHLCPLINNVEILPPMYTSYRRDRGDGWGGVIIITKKNLTVK